MKRFLWRLVQVGLLLIAVLSIDTVANHFGSSKGVHRVYYPGTQNVQLECPLDYRGKLHGEMHTYHPSGRHMRTTVYVHGQVGPGVLYEDLTLDEVLE